MRALSGGCVRLERVREKKKEKKKKKKVEGELT
jgi:hypothetical protein